MFLDTSCLLYERPSSLHRNLWSEHTIPDSLKFCLILDNPNPIQELSVHPMLSMRDIHNQVLSKVTHFCHYSDYWTQAKELLQQVITDEGDECLVVIVCQGASFGKKIKKMLNEQQSLRRLKVKIFCISNSTNLQSEDNTNTNIRVFPLKRDTALPREQIQLLTKSIVAALKALLQPRLVVPPLSSFADCQPAFTPYQLEWIPEIRKRLINIKFALQITTNRLDDAQKDFQYLLSLIKAEEMIQQYINLKQLINGSSQADKLISFRQSALYQLINRILRRNRLSQILYIRSALLQFNLQSEQLLQQANFPVFCSIKPSKKRWQSMKYSEAYFLFSNEIIIEKWNKKQPPTQDEVMIIQIDSAQGLTHQVYANGLVVFQVNSLFQLKQATTTPLSIKALCLSCWPKQLNLMAFWLERNGSSLDSQLQVYERTMEYLTARSLAQRVLSIVPSIVYEPYKILMNMDEEKRCQHQYFMDLSPNGQKFILLILKRLTNYCCALEDYKAAQFYSDILEELIENVEEREKMLCLGTDKNELCKKEILFKKVEILCHLNQFTQCSSRLSKYLEQITDNSNQQIKQSFEKNKNMPYDQIWNNESSKQYFKILIQVNMKKAEVFLCHKQVCQSNRFNLYLQNCLRRCQFYLEKALAFIDISNKKLGWKEKEREELLKLTIKFDMLYAKLHKSERNQLQYHTKAKKKIQNFKPLYYLDCLNTLYTCAIASLENKPYSEAIEEIQFCRKLSEYADEPQSFHSLCSLKIAECLRKQDKMEESEQAFTLIINSLNDKLQMENALSEDQLSTAGLTKSEKLIIQQALEALGDINVHYREYSQALAKYKICQGMNLECEEGKMRGEMVTNKINRLNEGIFSNRQLVPWIPLAQVPF